MELFDTTYIIDITNSDTGAVKKAVEIDEQGILPAISAISVHEYLTGVYIKYGNQSKQIRSKLAYARQDLSSFEVLPLTQEIAEISSMVHANLIKDGNIIGINDIYIAATAAYYNIKLNTRNVSHFRRIRGLEVELY